MPRDSDDHANARPLLSNLSSESIRIGKFILPRSRDFADKEGAAFIHERPSFGILFFVRTKESFTIEMNEVSRSVSDPHLGFPRNIV